jgi:putative ABC transport system permease protein
VRSRDRGNQGETKAKSLLGDRGQAERIGDRAATAPGARRARPSRRETQFLLEAAALAVIGGILGVALGCLATAVVAHVGGNPVTIPLSARLAGLGAATALGVLAGAYPAARAARLSPADALRAP